MAEPTKEYSNGEIVVVWKSELCIHSARGLPGVFQPKSRPWVKVDQASSAEITAQVDKCPSGALSWYSLADGPPAE
jgi:uncharacterized Fe-S cluster protein YjdI